MKEVYLIILFTSYCLTHSQRSVAQVSKDFDKIKLFVPSVYTILDVASGDMNEDGFVDYALVLRNENEERNGDELRPLLLIMGSKNGQFALHERNDSVVLCRNCGGVFGDPFQGISIKDGVLSIEHNVGSNWRWSRNISFKYDTIFKEFVLDSDVKVSYQKFKYKQPFAEPKKEEDKKLFFRSYSFARNL